MEWTNLQKIALKMWNINLFYIFVGSIEYLFLPFGGLCSGLITDWLGRKKSTILMNIPFIIGWFMLYQTYYAWQIYVAFALLGFAIGLTVQVSIYFGEIWYETIYNSSDKMYPN